MARERAEQLEMRRQAAEAIARRIEGEQLALEGQRDGGYEISADGGDLVLRTISATQRLFKDLLECHQRSVEAQKRLRLMSDKIELFRLQCDSGRNELSRLRRAIRLIENSPALRELGASESELVELRKTLARREEAVQELMAVRKAREDQLSAANRCCALLKVATNEREALFQLRMREMAGLEKSMQSDARDCRLQKEVIMAQRDAVADSAARISRRLHSLEAERKRLKSVTDEYVDTDLWVEGVLQRCRTKEFKHYLKSEVAEIKAKLGEVNAEVQQLLEKIMILSDKQMKFERDCAKMSLATRSFTEALKKVEVERLADFPKQLIDRQVSD